MTHYECYLYVNQYDPDGTSCWLVPSLQVINEPPVRKQGIM